MCGIFGYVGPDNSVEACFTGLKKLQYRGYDSAGVAGIGIADGQLHFCKQVGTIESLTKAWNNRPPAHLGLAIGHTRWATHGKPSYENAHPHFDEKFNLAVVHNGIIENHNNLRSMLKGYDIQFQTETDTEVIAKLIAHFYEGDLLSSVRKALSLMHGFWALAVIHKNHPDMIVAAAKENPLVIAQHQHKQETYLSSDPNAFHLPDLDLLFLRNDEIAVIKSDSVDIFDPSHHPILKTTERLILDNTAQSKGLFDHFMQKEIFEQPKTIEQALHSRFIEEFGTVEFEHFHFTPQELLSIKRIVILGCGTSWHAACIGALLLEEKARIPAQAEISSEFRYKNPIITEDTLVIAISQSGETLDTIAAVREVKRKGAKVVGICNVRNSSLAREVDSILFLRAGPEISVCSTKAFTSQITVLALFSLLMGRLHHISKEEGQSFLHELRSLPKIIEEILAQTCLIEALAKKYARFDNFFFLGRNHMHITSLEAALKLKEISYLNAIGYPAGEMKHGPIALACPELAIIGLCGNQKTYDKTLSNLTEVKSRGAPILAFAFEGSQEISEIADDTFFIPPICDELASIPFSVALQLLAYYIAKERGTEIDQPRNLAKSVTVE